MRWGIIPVQFSFITKSYGMKLYINDSIPTNTNIELRKCWHFYILKLLFLSIFCRYIENKPWLNFIWGGGGQAPPTSTPVVPFTYYVLLMNSIKQYFIVPVSPDEMSHRNGDCAVSHRAGALRNKARTHGRACCSALFRQPGHLIRMDISSGDTGTCFFLARVVGSVCIIDRTRTSLPNDML